METLEGFDIVRSVLQKNMPTDVNDPFIRGIATGYNLAIELLNYVEGLSCN